MTSKGVTPIRLKCGNVPHVAKSRKAAHDWINRLAGLETRLVELIPSVEKALTRALVLADEGRKDWAGRVNQVEPAWKESERYARIYKAVAQAVRSMGVRLEGAEHVGPDAPHG